jgi:peptidoglycan/xylan/chitin deacetylase (PgdA/CDA1 family)
MDSWMIEASAAVVVGIAGVTALGAVHPRAQLFGKTVCHTNRPEKLAITFDDGPNPAITPRLLELLAKHNAKATFFLVGKYVRESPTLVKEIAHQGHLLGNHTDTHPNLIFCSPTRTQDELICCSDSLANITGEKPRWFRPPFGFRSPWLSGITQRQGMRTAMWTMIPGDWRVVPPERLIRRMNPIAEHARKKLPPGTGYGGGLTGDIVCLHDGDYARPNANRTHTLAALEYWLPRWSDLGLKFVTMEETISKTVED